MQEKCKKCEDLREKQICGLCSECWDKMQDYHKPQEKSVGEDWKKELRQLPQLYKASKGDIEAIELFILNLQKETDDKWKNRVGEKIEELEELAEHYHTMGNGQALEALDQATNIIKELGK